MDKDHLIQIDQLVNNLAEKKGIPLGSDALRKSFRRRVLRTGESANLAHTAIQVRLDFLTEQGKIKLTLRKPTGETREMIIDINDFLDG